ncbi:transporter [Acidovorax sp. NCPPB 2350]|nr:transporter [Acidovorax sp. NCPPB 2350]
MRKSALTMALLALAGPGAALATENGGLAIYPDGLENYFVGALPPPGVHLLMYGGTLRYDTLRGNAGQSLVPDFKVDVNVLAPRLVWVTQQQVAGGQLAFHAIAPLLDIKFRAGGATFKSSGLGDVTLGAALGYHLSPQWHQVVGVDVYAPTGSYSATDPSSPGKNYWTVQPVYALTYMQPAGLNADLKLMYDINQRNDDTRTRSGQALHADYAAGWGLGNGWVVGVGGHVFRQVTDDSGPGSAQGKARAVGFGPSIRYANDKGLLVTVKWQKEYGVRNRPEGSQLFVKASIPF